MRAFADILIVVGVMALTPPVLLVAAEPVSQLEPLSILAAVGAGMLTAGVVIHLRRAGRGNTPPAIDKQL